MILYLHLNLNLLLVPSLRNSLQLKPHLYLYWFLFLYLTNCLNLYFYLILYLHLCVCNFIWLFILICIRPEFSRIWNCLISCSGVWKQTRIYGVYHFGTSLLCGIIVMREIHFGFLYFSRKIVCSFATCSTCSEKCEAQH